MYAPVSGQAVVTGVVPSSPRCIPSIFIARRVQQSHCSSIFHRALLTHVLALSASQFVHKKKHPPIYTSIHSGGFELTKLNYTRLEDNLICYRGDRFYCMYYPVSYLVYCTDIGVKRIITNLNQLFCFLVGYLYYLVHFGRYYMEKYNIAGEVLPHTAIIDPRTGAQLLKVVGFVEPEDLSMAIVEFLENNSIDQVLVQG